MVNDKKGLFDTDPAEMDRRLEAVRKRNLQEGVNREGLLFAILLVLLAVYSAWRWFA